MVPSRRWITRSARSLMLRGRAQDSASSFVGKCFRARVAPSFMTLHPPPIAGTTCRDFLILFIVMMIAPRCWSLIRAQQVMFLLWSAVAVVTSLALYAIALAAVDLLPGSKIGD
jgi:hypothetical protein